MQAIARHIGTKTEEEVFEYHKVFSQNINLLSDAARIKKTLEKSNEVHSFKRQAPGLIKGKVTGVERPLDEMVLNPI